MHSAIKSGRWKGTKAIAAGEIRLAPLLPEYWRVTFDLPSLNIFGPANIPQLEEIVSSLEADARVKVDVFDSAIEGFFLTHDDFLAKPEESAKFRRAGLVCKHCRTCSCGLVDGGLVPGGGPMDRLRRLIGCGRALEVLLTANDINGDLAELYGYVNRSLPDSKLDDFVDGLAKRIASFDKQAITGGGEQPVDCRSRRLTWRVRPSMLELARASRSSYRGCNSPRIVGINSDTVG